MRTFLGVLMVVIISGDDTTIRGFLEDSVLLPCNCSEWEEEFRWQMEETNVTLMFNYNKTVLNRYTGRTKTFLSENSSNCSVLLTNITAEDQGKYRCSFRKERFAIYEKFYVNLNVSARYSVCVQPKESLSGGVKVFRCTVSGRHKESWIQWTLDGRPLTNSTTTNITHTNNTDALTGLYHFNSTLSTKLDWTSEPTCDVKAKNISILNLGCGETSELFQAQKTQPVVWIRYCLKLIPIVLVLGLFLLLFSGRLQRKQKVNTDNV